MYEQLLDEVLSVGVETLGEFEVEGLDLLEGEVLRPASKGRLPGDELVKDAADGPVIGAVRGRVNNEVLKQVWSGNSRLGRRVIHQDLGADVLRRADERALRSSRRRRR